MRESGNNNSCLISFSVVFGFHFLFHEWFFFSFVLTALCHSRHSTLCSSTPFSISFWRHKDKRTGKQNQPEREIVFIYLLRRLCILILYFSLVMQAVFGVCVCLYAYVVCSVFAKANASLLYHFVCIF